VPEERSEIEIGRWYFRHMAEEQRLEAKRVRPGRRVEVREVVEPYTQSRRPMYLVVLVVEERGGGGESQVY